VLFVYVEIAHQLSNQSVCPGFGRSSCTVAVKDEIDDVEETVDVVVGVGEGVIGGAAAEGKFVG
jgi:hypothetical protein